MIPTTYFMVATEIIQQKLNELRDKIPEFFESANKCLEVVVFIHTLKSINYIRVI